ncbi:MAG TPA: OmpH family outer membrane protein [Tenuifilaceae bacterium]|nr:OmpH family outer membrane protein [Tenuifilaceae bacterium]HPS04180.1 OmpH family outer membrane protein [Tenuifilaceae bacterium]HPW27497.1 OmpH family outer membrane protein [Tenuifilaceae bacterium]HQM05137.1 OmpH family outer membrane protein [Tenuifilaceae bacterium]
MKKSTLIFNIILSLAVVALFILHFTQKSPRNHVSGSTPSEASAALSEGLSVAWVNMDSLLNHYDMYFDMRKELENNSRNLEAQLNSKSKAFEQDAMDFQNKVQKGLVTRSEAQQLQTSLANREQELYKLRDDMQMQLAEEEQVKLRQIHYSITEYLKKYNADKGYHIILSSNFGGPLLYGHPALDITSEVIGGINQEYAANHKTDK